MKLYDLVGGVEKFLKKFESNAKKISSSVLALSQLNLAILPSILPSVGMVDPLNLLKAETALAEQEEILEIEVPQLVIGLAAIVEIQEDKVFEVETVESRAEKKIRKAKEAEAAKKTEQARKAREAAEKAKQQSVIGMASVGTGNCEDYRSLVAKYFPSSQVNNALLVMSKESGCRENALSRTQDYGLMQIHLPAHGSKVNWNASALFDPETNIRIAAGIYNGRGNWSAWYAVCTPRKIPKFIGIHCVGRI